MCIDNMPTTITKLVVESGQPLTLRRDAVYPIGTAWRDQSRPGLQQQRYLLS
jgi:hypothetical protein